MIDEKKPMIVIDLNDNVKILVGKYDKPIFSLYKGFEKKLNEHVFKNGEIIDIQGLATIIDPILKKEKLQRYKVVFVISSTYVITKIIPFPNMNPKYLKKMIHYYMKPYIKYSNQEYILQYKKLIPFYKQYPCNLLIQAMPKSIVRKYLQLVKLLHLKPLALDTYENSIQKIYPIFYRDSFSKSVGIMERTYDFLYLYIIDKGILKKSLILSIDKHKKSFIDMTKVKNELTHYQIEEIYWVSAYENATDVPKALTTYLNVPIYSIDKIKNIEYKHSLNDFKPIKYQHALGAMIRE